MSEARPRSAWRGAYGSARRRAAPLFDPTSYGTWFESPLGRRVWTDEVRALAAVLEAAPGWYVLDAGCGDGRLALWLAHRVRQVTAVDSSEAMLVAAARRRSDDAAVNLARADVHALPFPDDTFDAAIAMTVMCFVHDPIVALRELARVVRPGGRVVIGELGRWSAWALWRRLESRWKGGQWTAARFWSKRELARALHEAGLVAGSFRAAVFYPKSASIARLAAPVGSLIGRRTTIGAAFIAVAGVKPAASARLEITPPVPVSAEAEP